jgi:hypothetical protein
MSSFTSRPGDSVLVIIVKPFALILSITGRRFGTENPM